MGMEAAHGALMGLEKFSVSCEGALGGKEGQIPLCSAEGVGSPRTGCATPAGQDQGRQELWGTASRVPLSPHSGIQGEGIQEVDHSPCFYLCLKHTHTHTPLRKPPQLWFASGNRMGSAVGGGPEGWAGWRKS